MKELIPTEETMEFFLDIIPPTVTAQMHKITIRYGKPQIYDTPKLKAARALFCAALRPYRPREPMQGPVSLTVEWFFSTKSHKEGEFRTTRPDTDNIQKLLKDCMTMVGFWGDDAQVCREKVIKRWSKVSPGISIRVHEINE